MSEKVSEWLLALTVQTPEDLWEYSQTRQFLQQHVEHRQ